MHMGLNNRTWSIEHTLGQKLMLSFKGKGTLPEEVLKAIRNYRPAGFSLFRAFNIEQPEQVRQLTDSLQRVAREEDLPSFMIAADQEGGQLLAIGEGTTPLPGNLALGATASPELAYKAGLVLGCELAAMGINVNFAPICDVNINPENPVIGTRSFGEDPESVARLAAAMTAGIQASGVAATAKHFPGHGDTTSDSHYGIPSMPHTLDRLRRVEFPPFRAAIQEGVKIIMTAHLALSGISGLEGIPSTLSPKVIKGLLRGELAYEGVIITDAMDMKAIKQGEELGEDAVKAVAAGCDLLLLTTDPGDHRHVYNSLLEAYQSGLLEPKEMINSARRITALKEWLGSQPVPPDLSVVGNADHQAVAAEIASASITLVRDQAGILPLQLQERQRLTVIMPQPIDLTPADTSSYVKPVLANALRDFYPYVDEFIIPHSPDEQEISAILERVREYQAVVLGTINAYTQPRQASLVKAILDLSIPTIIVALRMPYDLKSFSQAPTYLCTYSLLEPSMLALAQVIAGKIKPCGKLPVSIPGLYPRQATI
jgi:beta-N-acetylhexosaminidase